MSITHDEVENKPILGMLFLFCSAIPYPDGESYQQSVSPRSNFTVGKGEKTWYRSNFFYEVNGSFFWQIGVRKLWV